MTSASRVRVLWRAAGVALLLSGVVLPAWSSVKIQPVSRHEADDPASLQAVLLARTYGGRVYEPLGEHALPPGVTAHDLLVSRRPDLAMLRPGDLVAVRTSGDPLPLASEPVSLRRFVGVEECGPDCRRILTASLDREHREAVAPRHVVGHVLFAIDRQSGVLREFRRADAAEPTTVVDAYNAWRPQWTAEAVGKRLHEMQQPARTTPARPRRIYTLDVLEPRRSVERGIPIEAFRR